MITRRWPIAIAVLALVAGCAADRRPTSSSPPTVPTSATIRGGGLAAESEEIALPNPAPPDAFGGASVQDVAATADGFVAVGSLNGACCTRGFSPEGRALVWVSGDGVSWELAGEAAALETARLNAVALGDAGLVAVGSQLVQGAGGQGQAPAAAWSSADGVRWASAEMDGPGGTLFSVTAFTSGYAALGSGTPVDPVALVWTSDEGRRWTATLLTDLGIDGFLPQAIVTAPDGRLVMAGGGDVPEAPGQAWLSTDGVAWEPATEAPPVAISTIGRAGDSLLAFGSAADGSRPGVWRSLDGDAWSAVPELALPRNAAINDIGSLPDGRLVAVGYGIVGVATPAIWVSGEDGWTLLETGRTRAGEVSALAADGTRLVGVGYAHTPPEAPAPWAWVLSAAE